MIKVDTLEPFITNNKYSIFLFYSNLINDLNEFKVATEMLSLYKDVQTKAKFGPVKLKDNILICNIKDFKSILSSSKLIKVVMLGSSTLNLNIDYSKIDILYNVSKAPTPEDNPNDKSFSQLKCICNIVAPISAINLTKDNMKCIYENYLFYLVETNQISKTDYERQYDLIPFHLKPTGLLTLKFGDVNLNNMFDFTSFVVGKDHENEIKNTCSRMVANQLILLLKKHTTVRGLEIKKLNTKRHFYKT